MLAEQTLLNAAVLLVDWTSVDAAVAGFVFNVLLIARAPLQLFQAIQGSLLPHLAGLEAREGRAEFARAIRVTILAIAGFAGAVALGLLLLGPWAMDILFDDAFTYGRWGLALVALGMGAHLAAGTLNQAALARDRAGAAAACWLFSAAAFVAFMVSPLIDDELVRAQVGYCGAAALLCALLAVLYRATSASPGRTCAWPCLTTPHFFLLGFGPAPSDRPFSAQEQHPAREPAGEHRGHQRQVVAGLRDDEHVDRRRGQRGRQDAGQQQRAAAQDPGQQPGEGEQDERDVGHADLPGGVAGAAARVARPHALDLVDHHPRVADRILPDVAGDVLARLQRDRAVELQVGMAVGDHREHRACLEIEVGAVRSFGLRRLAAAPSERFIPTVVPLPGQVGADEQRRARATRDGDELVGAL